MKKVFSLLGLLSLLFFFNSVLATSFTIGKIIAYPNPFNPETENLTVKPESSAYFDGTAEYTVYNYNERAIYSGKVSNSVIIWNGHKADGSRAIPGLYILKVIQTRSDNAVGVGYTKILVK